MPILIVLIAVPLIAIAGLALLIFSYWRAHVLLRPLRSPLACSPADVDLQMETVSFVSPRGKLSGWYLPAENGRTLLCCHGINDNCSQWLHQIARLHERGYGALLFDFAGHGLSEGRLVTFGAREQLDVVAAVRYLRERGDVDMNGLAILGYSLGGITAVLAAAQLPELRALVVESAFADLQQDVAKVFTRYTGLPAFPFVPLIIFWGQLISGARLSEIRPARVIGRISPRAVFVISDLGDELADEPHDGEQLYAAAGEPKALWQIPEAGHVSAFLVKPEEWARRVGDFLDEHLASTLDLHASTQADAGSAGVQVASASTEAH
jgi:alpha-beta hydrolase superfamily lysophospholipase